MSEETATLIASAVRYCSLLKIDSLLIDKTGIRAKQDETAVYLIEPGDFSFLEFDTLFINRVSSLQSRLNMYHMSKIEYEMYLDIKELDNGENIAATIMIVGISKGRDTTVKFNCSNPALGGRLPKRVNDGDLVSFTFEKDSLQVLNRGVSAMGAQFFNVFSEDGGSVVAEVKDIEGDVLTHTLSNQYEKLGEESEDFTFNYDFKIILPLLREACKENDTEIILTSRGIMNLNINGLNMYIFPEAQ